MISLDVVVAGRQEFRQYGPSEKLLRLYGEVAFGWHVDRNNVTMVRVGDWILDKVSGKWVEVTGIREFGVHRSWLQEASP